MLSYLLMGVNAVFSYGIGLILSLDQLLINFIDVIMCLYDRSEKEENK